MELPASPSPGCGRPLGSGEGLTQLKGQEAEVQGGTGPRGIS